jgi:hypothetical protein
MLNGTCNVDPAILVENKMKARADAALADNRVKSTPNPVRNIELYKETGVVGSHGSSPPGALPHVAARRIDQTYSEHEDLKEKRNYNPIQELSKKDPQYKT